MDIYEQICEGCPNEKYCHESCEVCDLYLEMEENVTELHTSNPDIG